VSWSHHQLIPACLAGLPWRAPPLAGPRVGIR
jgi:hypothetical protein